MELGLAYAEAVDGNGEAACTEARSVGCHGQTLYHQAVLKATRAGGSRAPGNSASCGDCRGGGVPVVSNFRPPISSRRPGSAAGSAAGLCAVCRPRRGRVLQNIAGHRNLTAIPAGAAADAVVAFDTGPGNMIIDALPGALRQTFRPQWRHCRSRAKAGGGFVSRARPIPTLSRGRRHSGARAIWREVCRKVSGLLPAQSNRPEDVLSTATALTQRLLRAATNLLSCAE